MTTRTAKKTTTPNTATVTTSGAAPEDFRHETLWCVVTKTTRSGPWTLVMTANGEHLARLMFDHITSTDAHVALVPSLASGGFNATRAYDEVEDCEGDASYKARAPKAIEEWNDRRVIR